MLRRLRSQSNNILVKLLLGLLVASFALWGIGDIFRSSGQSADVVELDGANITAAEYQRELRDRVQRFQQLSGQITSEMLTQLGVPQQVLGELIHRRVMEQAAADYGIRVPEEKLLRSIRTTPAFLTQEGKFSAALFRDALRQAGITEQEYFQLLASEQAAQLVLNTLQGDKLVSAPLQQLVAQMQSANRDVTLFTLPLAAIPVPSAADEDALRSYYEEHINAFESPESRDVAYVKLTYDDIAADLQPDEAALRDLYEQRRAEFTDPERRSVTQLLYNEQASARAAAQALRGGATLVEVAERFPPLSGIQRLGNVTSAEVPEEARETVFDLAEGATSEPIETTLGWHLFTVEAVQPPRERPFEELREQLAEEQLRYDTEDQLYRRITELEDAVAGGATLQEIASELGLQATTVTGIRAQQESPALPDISNLRDIIFALEEGSTSEVLSDEEGNAYLLAVHSVTPAREKPFDEVRAEVAERWQEERRRILLAETAATIAKAQREGKDASRAGLSARQFSGITWQQLQDEESELPASLRQSIVHLSPGEVSEPVAEDEHYQWVRLNRLEAQAELPKEAMETAASEIKDAYPLEILSDYLQHLRGEYNVQVNEDVLRSLLPQ